MSWRDGHGKEIRVWEKQPFCIERVIKVWRKKDKKKGREKKEKRESFIGGGKSFRSSA
jgi:hypothetical protein